MTLRAAAGYFVLAGLILVLATVAGCGSPDVPADASRAEGRDSPVDSPGRIAALIDSLYERVLDHPDDPDGYLKLARLLSTLRRFEDADRVLLAADSAGLCHSSLADLRMANLLTWAGYARDDRDSLTFARCMLRLIAVPLPDSLLPVVARLAGIGYPAIQITDNVVADYAPRFSPDGRSLVYFSRLEREAEEYGGRYSIRYQTQICTVGVDGSEPSIISDGRASEFFPDYSPDGRWIVCQRSDGDTLKAEWMAAGGSYLYLYDLHLGEGHRLGANNIYGRCPKFVPHSGDVVFVTGSAGDQGWVSTIDIATDEITPRYRYSTFLRFNIPRLAFFPSIFPDGKHMVFQAGLFKNKAIFIADEFGRDITRLTLNGSERQPAVSPDGATIVFVAENHDGMQLYIYSLADSTRRQITFDNYAKTFPSFSPDGRYIAFSARRADQTDADYELFILDLAYSFGRAEIEARVHSLAKELGLAL